MVMTDKLMNNWIEYINGNYSVKLNTFDGTKIRETLNDNDTSFIPEFCESFDLKITNKCTGTMCAYCHENSSPNGLHGDILNAEFINTVHPFTELAIGGGNPLEHPDIVSFLRILKTRKIIANVTLNQKHFVENKSFIDYLISEKLIYGLGVSVTEVTDELISLLQENPNIVVHIIYGVIGEFELKKLYNKGLKILILGYKIFRRGETWYNKNDNIFEVNADWMFTELLEMTKHFKVVSFDNLAIRQLNVRRLMNKEKWNHFYMGDDGQYTMYIDMVKEEFAGSSTRKERYPLLNNINDMFNIVRSE